MLKFKCMIGACLSWGPWVRNQQKGEKNKQKEKKKILRPWKRDWKILQLQCQLSFHEWVKILRERAEYLLHNSVYDFLFLCIQVMQLSINVQVFNYKESWKPNSNNCGLKSQITKNSYKLNAPKISNALKVIKAFNGKNVWSMESIMLDNKNFAFLFFYFFFRNCLWLVSFKEAEWVVRV